MQSSTDLTVIKPLKKWSALNLQALWHYRELLWVMMLRDIKVRYKQTVMGVAWAVIQPVTAMIIFTLIFGKLARIPSDGVPYPVFVFSGMLAWNFFSTSISSSGASLVGSASLISKVYFPRLIVPLSTIGVSVVDFIISVVILLILMLIYSVSLSWQVLLVPLLFAGLMMTVFGIGAWLASVTVVYRDFRFVIPFMLQIWMYVTPVIYPVSFVPEKWQWLMYLNPVFGWVDNIRSCFLGLPINGMAIIISTLITIGLLFLGIRFFEKSEQRFADVI